MNAIPTTFAALNVALNGALPAYYRPCVPSPEPDRIFHITVALTGSTTPGTPTETLCGESATVSGATLGPLVLHDVCWERFINRLVSV